MDASNDTEVPQNTTCKNEPNAEATIPQSKRVKKKQSKLTRTDPASDDVNVPIRGMPKSGRMWKTTKERFAKVKKTIRGKRTAERLAYREEIKQIKELSQSIKEDRRRENEEKRLRREENARRRLENERKSEIVQIINNPAKLKRMRKKQLRMIEKRDLSKVKVV
ncbi:coiled-coil domain-containing protein 86 [Anopheles ziemanni]|uniref:coiled-coil domain-containing protein 86 n=1 Tax=Anopheles coustani TaxID=139045 RepID=UPI0026587DBD|nr:coiled-coil domain-containing protein 86 [Anopheles coustani]XP_058175738.1 coiled-coil domain-containing protein 86 [Anopheles ziemanni]